MADSQTAAHDLRRTRVRERSDHDGHVRQSGNTRVAATDPVPRATLSLSQNGSVGLNEETSTDPPGVHFLAYIAGRGVLHAGEQNLGTVRMPSPGAPVGRESTHSQWAEAHDRSVFPAAVLTGRNAAPAPAWHAAVMK